MEHLEVVAQDYVRISLDFKHAAEKEASQLLQHLAVQVAGGRLKLWVGGLVGTEPLDCRVGESLFGVSVKMQKPLSNVRKCEQGSVSDD